MTKAHLKIQMGGIAAATEAYRSSATPNVVIIESDGHGEELLGGLDMLAEVCDAGTRVIAIGHLNDIVLYREMVRRGVSDYLMAPIGPVAPAKVRGKEKMPAPTMPPTTIIVSANKVSRCVPGAVVIRTSSRA